jgi:hypothetical protein
VGIDTVDFDLENGERYEKEECGIKEVRSDENEPKLWFINKH